MVEPTFKVFDQLLEHVLQDGKLYFIVHCQHLDRDGLVDWQDLLNGWAIVPHQNSGGFLELALLEVGLGELHQVGVQHLSTLLLGETQALLPLTTLREHFQARHITTLDDLVELAQQEQHHKKEKHPT